jgi:WD40 repeat protein
MAHLRQAVELYQGDFLSGFYVSDNEVFEAWALLKRETFHRQALETFYHLTAWYEGQGNYKEAGRYAQRQLELEPWREEAHQQLMRLLALAGQRSAALAQYDTCRRILTVELGVEPGAETVALYEQIRTGEVKAEDRGLKIEDSPKIDPSSILPPPSSAQDWGEAPNITTFYGRQTEVAQLEQWLVTDRCRLVAVLGLGGMGKTTLTTKVTRSLAVPHTTGKFDFVFWRSLLNAPPLMDILQASLRFFSSQKLTDLPDTLAERLTLLFDCLRQHRCLLVLDNMESILQPGDRAGTYRPGYEDYGQLIQRLGQTDHQSCLLLTSRERPKGMARLEGDSPLVCSLQLIGLDARAGQELLQSGGLSGTAGLTASLLDRHSGNPLALKLVSRAIQELFNNDIAAFLSEETLIFDDIRDVLDQQFGRLSPLEQELLIWLAIEREAVSLQTLEDNLIHQPAKRNILEAIRSLQRRSLLETRNGNFTLQNVVIEYLTDYLIERVCQEIETGLSEQPSPQGTQSEGGAEASLLNRYALMKAGAKEYVRQSQVRLILHPVSKRLVSRLGQRELEASIKDLLEQLRSTFSRPTPRYAAGNLLNLLLHLGVEIQEYDFSRLSIRQAYLQGVSLTKVNFAGADLSRSIFTDTFGFIGSVAFGFDASQNGGEFLAAGTSTGEIRLWGVTEGYPYQALKGHTQAVWAVTFSPDGQILASGSEDQTILLWDSHRGSVRQILRGHTGTVRSLAFSPDGQTLASGSYDQTIRLWEVSTGRLLATLAGHNSRVWTVAFSPDGETLASGSDDHTLRLWDVRQNNGQPRLILDGHTEAVRSVAFSPDGQTLSSGSDDHTLRLWDAHTGQSRQVLTEHNNYILSVAFSPDGQTLVSSSADQTVRLWDAQTSQPRHILQGHTNMIWSVACNVKGQIVASGGGDQTVRLWDAHTVQLHYTLQGYANRGSAVAFSPTGQTVASAGSEGQICLWDAATGQLCRTLSGHSNWVWSVAFSADGQTLASSSADQTIRLWEVASGQSLLTLQGHTGRGRGVAFSPDGQTLASGSDDQTIRLWDVRTGFLLTILQGHTNWVWSVAFSPDGQTLASGSHDQTIGLWDVATGQLRHRFEGHTNRIWGIAFSPDGQTLASGSDDRTIRLWEVGSGQVRHILQGHSSEVWSVAFSPDGQTLASGSGDQTIRLWDVQTGEALATLTGHTGWVSAVAFSPDGQTLVSNSVDETVRLWEVSSGQCLHTLRAPGPYAGLNIIGVTGLSEAQKAALKALGAVEET